MEMPRQQPSSPSWGLAGDSEAFVTDGWASSSARQKATGPDGDLMGGSLLMGSAHQGNGSKERKKDFRTALTANQKAPACSHRGSYYVHYLDKYSISCHEWVNQWRANCTFALTTCSEACSSPPRLCSALSHCLQHLAAKPNDILAIRGEQVQWFHQAHGSAQLYLAAVQRKVVAWPLPGGKRCCWWKSCRGVAVFQRNCLYSQW